MLLYMLAFYVSVLRDWCAYLIKPRQVTLPLSQLSIILHNGELTLHYFLTVNCDSVQWPVCQEQKST